MTDPTTNNSEEPLEETTAGAPPPVEETAPPPVEESVPPPVEESAPPPVEESETIAPEQILATTGNRILAVLIDGLIAGAITGLLAAVAGIGPIIGLAYMLTRDALPFLDGQSIGKKAMKLRAISSETGKPLTSNWGPSVIRNIVLYIPLFPLVELFILSSNKEGQRLGDQWAKTKVIVDAS